MTGPDSPTAEAITTWLAEKGLRVARIDPRVESLPRRCQKQQVPGPNANDRHEPAHKNSENRGEPSERNQVRVRVKAAKLRRVNACQQQQAGYYHRTSWSGPRSIPVECMADAKTIF